MPPRGIDILVSSYTDISDARFIRVVETSRNRLEAMKRLGLAYSSIGQRIRTIRSKGYPLQIGSKWSQAHRKIDHIETFRLYRDTVTLNDLHEKSGVPEPTIRARILKAAKQLWSSPSPPTLPQPLSIGEVKAFHHLDRWPDATLQDILDATAATQKLSPHIEAYFERYQHAKRQHRSRLKAVEKLSPQELIPITVLPPDELARRLKLIPPELRPLSRSKICGVIRSSKRRSGKVNLSSIFKRSLTGGG